jgi:hypothetical protein
MRALLLLALYFVIPPQQIRVSISILSVSCSRAGLCFGAIRSLLRWPDINLEHLFYVTVNTIVYLAPLPSQPVHKAIKSLASHKQIP